jgi:hypothetical protein
VPLHHTPLDAQLLSEPAKKALAAVGPMKLMAARGLAPLPRAVDIACVIYSLALDPDAPVASSAQKTAGELPEKVLAGALTDATLDPRVIDFFALRVVGKPALVEAILLNKNTSDETYKDLASKCDERDLEIIAQNEQRLLRAPAIIGALYMNPKTRMSTVDRAVELAVRNQVTVPGVPSWDDVVAAVLGLHKPVAPPASPEAAAQDAVFAQVSAFAVGDQAIDDSLIEELLAEDEAGNPVAPSQTVEQKQTQISKLSIPGKIRLATLGNAFARAMLIRDSNKQVALAAIRSPGITDNEVAKFSANRGLSDDVIRVIANNKEWTRLYGVKLNLVQNPKCPLAVSMRFLPFLHDKDLKLMAKSKGIPSALSAQAKKLMTQKSGGK